ncbi:cystatin-C-like isoform 1-T1 [Discoglossus pictus]
MMAALRGFILLLFGLLCLAWADSASELMVGGWSPASLYSQEIQQAAKLCVRHYNMGSNDVYAYRLLGASNPKEQLVSGMNYAVDLSLGSTTCRNNQQYDAENCALEPEGQSKKVQCSCKVYVPFGGEPQLTQNHCAAV